MKEQGKTGGNEGRQIVPSQELQRPKEHVIVGVIGGVFMSSVPQTPEYRAMQEEVARKISQHRS